MNNKLAQKVDTKKVFFALAALWASLAPMLFVLSLFAFINLNFTLVEHGRGMLFGLTSALITGYLAGKRQLIEVVWLGALWCFTRGLEIFSMPQDWHLWLYVIYGGHIAFIVAPKFFAAKKIRNWLMSPTLAILALFPVLFFILSFYPVSRNELTFVFMQLLSLLMFFMAGRMITPLLVKANMKKGIKTQHRVQPHIEGLIIGFIIFSLIIQTAKFMVVLPQLHWFLAGANIAIAMLIVVRINRWQPNLLSKNDGAIWGLLLGYSWIAIAQLVLAGDIISQQINITSIHLLSIGGLGLLSSSIITVSMQKKRPVSYSYLIYAGLLSTAAITRYFAGVYVEHYLFLLLLTAFLWSLNFLIVFANLCLGDYGKRA